MNAVHNLWVSRQIGPFVVDFYPETDSDEVTLYIWRNGKRERGYSVECKNPDQVRAVIADVEAVA